MSLYGPVKTWWGQTVLPPARSLYRRLTPSDFQFILIFTHAAMYALGMIVGLALA